MILKNFQSVFFIVMHSLLLTAFELIYGKKHVFDNACFPVPGISGASAINEQTVLWG